MPHISSDSAPGVVDLSLIRIQTRGRLPAAAGTLLRRHAARSFARRSRRLSVSRAGVLLLLTLCALLGGRAVVAATGMQQLR